VVVEMVVVVMALVDKMEQLTLVAAEVVVKDQVLLLAVKESL
jgi:hypothetical protein